MDCHHRAVHLSLFVLIVAVVFVSLTLVAGVAGYRNGDRWLLLPLALMPVGVMVGIYAGDSHHRALGVLAFLLIVARPVIALVTRRPARLKGGPEV